MLLIGDQLARELRPIGAALGSGMVLTPLAIAACGVPSMIMLLNRAPALGLARVRPGQHATTIGANLVVGSTLMMLVVLLATTFAAEATACAIGVPNCD